MRTEKEIEDKLEELKQKSKIFPFPHSQCLKDPTKKCMRDIFFTPEEQSKSKYGCVICPHNPSYIGVCN
jgi:hypothetical protein